MKNSAVRHLKPVSGFKYNNNKNIIVALTVEKLSGSGVSCREDAVGFLNKIFQDSGCIFIAKQITNNNKPLTI